jgi:WD40 repeat protein
VATAAIDGTIRIWPTAVPPEPAVVRFSGTDAGGVLAVSSYGAMVLLGEYGEAQLFHPGTGAHERIQTPTLPHRGAFSRTGATLAIAAQGAVLAFRTTDPRTPIRHLDLPRDRDRDEAHFVRAVAVSDEYVVASPEWSPGSISVARLNDSAPVSFRLGNSAVNVLALSAAGDRIIAGFADGSVMTVSLDGKGATPLLPSHSSAVTAIAVGDEGVLATAGGLSVYVRSAGGKHAVLPNHVNSIHGLAFNPKSTRVVTSAGDGLMRIWNADGKGSPVLLAADPSSRFGASNVAFSADGRRVLFFGSREVRTWHLDARTQLWLHGPPCLEAETRQDLLGGSLEDARAATTRCKQTVAACRGNAEACEKAVHEAYDAAP